MRTWLLVILSAVALSPVAAHAIPTLAVQGNLENLAGEGVDGDYTLTFRLFDTDTSGIALWQEVLPAVAVAEGAFSAVLGITVPLTTDIVDRPAVWVEIAVGGEAPFVRQLLHRAPGAMVADRAHDVQCSSCISPEETTFLTGCANGQILRNVSGTWSCVDLVIPTYSGANFALSDQACPAGQVMRGVKADGTPTCAGDKDTTYSGANFAVSGQGCAVGQVVTGIGLDGSVVCGNDKDTTYSGANFAVSGKSCPTAGHVMRGVDAQGTPVCVPDFSETYDGTDFALANKACPSGQYVSGIAANGVPTCVADADTKYTGATFALSNKSCGSQVQKGVDAGGTPVCVNDANTLYDGADFALANKACTGNQVMRGISATGIPVCVTDTQPVYNGSDFAVANKSCAAGQYMTGISATGNPLCADLNDFINSKCYVYYGWIDSCDACTTHPTKYGRVTGTSCTVSGANSTCKQISLTNYASTWLLGINTAGDVNEDDKFYIGFKCD